MKKHMAVSVLIGLIVAVVDQISKCVVVASFGEPFFYKIRVIDNFFSIVYVTNSGSVWGMLQGWQYILSAIAVCVMIAMLVFNREFGLCMTRNKIFFGMLFGGILGNTIDRIFRGHVVDFLHFYIKTVSWPTFNVADIAISFACAILIFTKSSNRCAKSDD